MDDDDVDDDDVDEVDEEEEDEEDDKEDEESDEESDEDEEDEEEDTAVDSESGDSGSEPQSDDAWEHDDVAQPPPAKRQATAAKPPRARSFADFQLDPRLTRALVKAKLTTPTPVQAEAIPVALQVRRGSCLTAFFTGCPQSLTSLADILGWGTYYRAVTSCAAPRPAPARPPPTRCRCCKRSWSPKR